MDENLDLFLWILAFLQVENKEQLNQQFLGFIQRFELDFRVQAVRFRED